MSSTVKVDGYKASFSIQESFYELFQVSIPHTQKEVEELCDKWAELLGCEMTPKTIKAFQSLLSDESQRLQELAAALITIDHQRVHLERLKQRVEPVEIDVNIIH